MDRLAIEAGGQGERKAGADVWAALREQLEGLDVDELIRSGRKNGIVIGLPQHPPCVFCAVKVAELVASGEVANADDVFLEEGHHLH
jgi:hypothetical protein